jgi:predicted Zn-dependent peptidase
VIKNEYKGPTDEHSKTHEPFNLTPVNNDSQFGTGVLTGNQEVRNKEVGVRAITNIFHHLKKRGITNEELRRGKTIMKGNIAFGLENIGTRMIDFGKNEILDINEQSFMNFQQIEKQTKNDIEDVIHDIFSYEPSTSLIKGLIVD